MDVNVKGAIIPSEDGWIYDFFGIEYTSPKSVKEAIAKAGGEKLDVYINSPGGDVFSGTEIADSIRAYKGDVLIHITGLAASAATVVACARESEISPSSLFMVHNVSSYAEGDTHAMEHQAEVLQKANRAIAAAYTTKAGMTEAEALELMDRESWLTASEAVEKKLVDRITGAGAQTNSVKLAASASMNNGMIPQRIIDKMKAEKLENSQKAKLQAELELIKLGGIQND